MLISNKKNIFRFLVSNLFVYRFSVFKTWWCTVIVCSMPLLSWSAIPNLVMYAPETCVLGKGRGYEGGFLSTGAFVALADRDYCQVAFLDVQCMRVNPGRFAGSLGVGWRKILSDQSMFGCNVFYDSRCLYSSNLNQIGIGAEYTSRLFDLYVNGYCPFGKKSIFRSSLIYDYGSGFTAYCERNEVPLWGLDIEIGRHVALGNCAVGYLGIGPYFYEEFGSAKETTALLGGMTVVGINLFTYFDIAFLFTYDRIFYGCPQGLISLQIPFSRLASCLQPYTKQVRRNPIIVTTSSWKYNLNF